MWVYYDEHEKKNISKNSKDNAIYLRIKCGDYSYAEIVKDFSYIMGVTGTLECCGE
jgi:hypothetical protein